LEGLFLFIIEYTIEAAAASATAISSSHSSDSLVWYHIYVDLVSCKEDT